MAEEGGGDLVEARRAGGCAGARTICLSVSVRTTTRGGRSMQIAGIIGGARKVVRILARVKAGEKVLIAADTDTCVVAEALAVAALEITPEVVTTLMMPVSVDGDEPPAIVAAALVTVAMISIFAPLLRGVMDWRKKVVEIS